MRFASPYSWWLTAVLLGLVILGAYRSYAGSGLRLSIRRRWVLGGLRVTVLVLLLALLARPVRLEPVEFPRAVVPVLLDRSRSMGIADVDGVSRFEAGVALIRDQLEPVLRDDVELATWSFGDTLEPFDPALQGPDAGRTDLAAALTAIRDRYRDRPIAGIVVVSDGGITDGRDWAHGSGPPVFPIAIGARTPLRDREVRDLTVGPVFAAGSFIELAVSVASHGFEAQSFGLRVLEDGELIRTLEINPPAGGGVVHRMIPVSPRQTSTSQYTVAIPIEESELVSGNNEQSVLVPPPERPRRLLFIEGAPGYEHSFLKRVLHDDAGLEIDAVIQKGQNDRGERTFYVQGHAERTQALASGYPETREALFAYDAVILANAEETLLRPAQIEMTRDFVSERGGGLLVMGARSFAARGLWETELVSVLPLEPAARIGPDDYRWSRLEGMPHRVEVTQEGEGHPIMRLADDAAVTRERWSTLSTLGNVVPAGALRPGAAVLATGTADGGETRPVVAVQRFGFGRAMVFTGEASWRWQMLMPSTDDTYERYWRQAARWLSVGALDPVRLLIEGGRAAGDPWRMEVLVVDDMFEAVADAEVRVTLTEPTGDVRSFAATPVTGAFGQYALEVTPDMTGRHDVSVEVMRGTDRLGQVGQAVLVGGTDPELTDARRHDQVLGRMAHVTGGRPINVGEFEELSGLVQAKVFDVPPPAVHDAWNTIWVFGFVVVALAAEWGLRRRWGLR